MVEGAIRERARQNPVRATRLTAVPAEMGLAHSSALPAELIESIEAVMPDIVNTARTRSSSAQSAEPVESNHDAGFIGMLASSEPSNSSASDDEPEASNSTLWKLPVTSESSDTDLEPDLEKKEFV